METKSKSLYDMSSSGTEIFTHGGVGYVPPSATKDDVQTCGTLSIVSYSFGKCIEWKPNDVSIETDGSEQEWAMVNTSKSPSASSNSGGDTNPQRWLPVRIPILEIKSYRVSNKKTKLLLVHKDRLTHTAFYFQFENADCFTKSLRSVVKTRRSRHDKHTYDIVQERADPQMPHSFSDFNLLSDQKETVWKFVSDMRSRPYETTLSTFSKFSEYLLYKIQMRDHQKKWLDYLKDDPNNRNLLFSMVRSPMGSVSTTLLKGEKSYHPESFAQEDNP
uniref:TBC1 domain family member 15 n=1 Tax=Lygus hesperus TaxID=30085 RepID=A0A0A9W7U9_LYGHE